MKYRLLVFASIIAIVTAISSSTVTKNDPKICKAQKSVFSEMTFAQLDSILQQEIFKGEVNAKTIKPNWEKILREHRRRIYADPDSFASSFLLQDNTLHPRYRQYLFDTYSQSTRTMSPTTLEGLVLVMEQVFADRNESEFIRQAAMMASDGFVLAAKKMDVLGVHQLDGFTKMNMDIILDDTESSGIRCRAVHALRSRRQRSEAPKLLELVTSGKIRGQQLELKIIPLLGEWKYMELLPVAISLLKTTDDGKLLDALAYAVGRLGSFETFGPLLECIDRKRDFKFSGGDALHKNAPLIYQILKTGNDEKVLLALRACRHVRGTPKELVSSLSLLLDNDNPQIVLSAAKRLTRSGDPDLVSLVLEHLKEPPSGSDLEVFWNQLYSRANSEIHIIQSINK